MPTMPQQRRRSQYELSMQVTLQQLRALADGSMPRDLHEHIVATARASVPPPIDRRSEPRTLVVRRNGVTVSRRLDA